MGASERYVVGLGIGFLLSVSHGWIEEFSTQNKSRSEITFMLSLETTTARRRCSEMPSNLPAK